METNSRESLLKNGLLVTKQFKFCYGHSLPRHEGKCSSQHGHNSTLEVTLQGFLKKEGPEDGMVVDFANISSVVKEKIINELDHKYLNEIDGLENPTAEHILLWIFERLFPVWRFNLHSIRLYETDDNWVEWRKR